jgi:hypothetical protein
MENRFVTGTVLTVDGGLVLPETSQRPGVLPGSLVILVEE